MSRIVVGRDNNDVEGKAIDTFENILYHRFLFFCP